MSDEQPPTDRQIERDEKQRLDNLPIEEVIRRGHEELLRTLVAKSTAGTISHQEMAILRNMLRDNGMTLGVPPKDADLPKPEQPADLPTYSKPDYE